jgi:DNA-binding transcriptional LysR family regulator
MTLEQLRYFMAAARFEHVNQAAQSIPISPSVISQAIKSLEEELECSLFLREKKRIRLTQEGARLLELAEEILEKASAVRQELGKSNPPIKGHCRAGASHFLSTKILTPVLTAMQKTYPDLTVDVHSQPTWALVDSILAGRIDFGIGFSPVPHPQLEYQEVFRGHSVVMVRKDHPIFERGKKDHYKLLGEYPATMHIATEKIFMARVHPFFKSAHLERNIKFGFDSDFVAFENLKASDNWCLMLDIVAADFKKNLVEIKIPQESGSHYTVQLIKSKSRKPDGAMIDAFNRIRAAFIKLSEKME